MVYRKAEQTVAVKEKHKKTHTHTHYTVSVFNTCSYRDADHLLACGSSTAGVGAFVAGV